MTAIYDFFIHNWKAEASLETSFVTDIAQSPESLTEERQALLLHPRRVLTLHWTGVTRDETNRLLMALMRGGMQQLLVPFAQDQSVTTSSSSGTTINCDTTNRHFAVGQKVLIFNPQSRAANAQVGTVTVVAAGALTLSASLSGSYAAGALVFPLMLAELVLQGELELLTDQKSDLSLSFFEVLKTGVPSSTTTSSPGSFGTQTSSANAAAASTTPILDVSPDFSTPVRTRVARAGTKFALGRDTAVDAQGGRPQLEHTFNLLMVRRSDSWAALKFFESRKGRLLPFWLVNPATLYSHVGTASGYVDVTVSGDLTNVQDFLEYVAVVMKDGTIYVRKVTSIALVSGNWRISASIPSLTLGDIKRVTSAHFVRFTSDAFKLDYLADGIARAAITAVEVLAETVTDATDTSVGVCTAPTIDCSGPWSICLVSYLMDPLAIGGDCGACLIGFNLHTITLDSDDPCIQDLSVALALGYWDGATFHSGAGGCAGSVDTVPVDLHDTFGEYELVYAGDHGGMGRAVHVYANMVRTITGATPAPCTYAGDIVPDDRIPYGAACVDIEVQSGWF